MPAEMLWYKMNDDATNTTITDSSGNSHTGTLLGGDNTADLSITGKIGKALNFNGTDDRIDLPGAPANNTTDYGDPVTYDDDEDWSVSFWYKGTDATVAASVFDVSGIFGWNSGSVLAGIGLDGGKLTYFRFEGSYKKLQSTTSINDDSWHHCVIVNNSDATLDMYIDNSLELDGVGSGITESFVFQMATIGLTYSGEYLEGALDDVRIFRDALSSDNVSSLWNDGSGTEVALDDLGTGGSTGNLALLGVGS